MNATTRINKEEEGTLSLSLEYHHHPLDKAVVLESPLLIISNTHQTTLQGNTLLILMLVQGNVKDTFHDRDTQLLILIKDLRVEGDRLK